ncbi:uncharacterized protein DUF664 [Stackebrandtia albiflava]|uniref:Uncharacterized protein DUF664 n=1 Tax=Stackebrandtia albiflava TaxID=406432 RepID=A0A562UZA2_9ACTN|nr:DinB family protein [Stackebrandtia albiflava]TWJ10848.1 uncharacterized protein DUF664 [Stackebrandtia albiflava]
MPKTTFPVRGDERAQLTAFLDQQRRLVRTKCEGLSEADAHRSLLPSSPLTTVAGLVSHLRWVEYSWFHLNLLGTPDSGQTPWAPDRHPDAEMMVDSVPLAELLDDYDAECARSRAIAAAHSLDDVEKAPPPAEAGSSGPVSLRYILLHMIEETARHLGHLDLLREMSDGVKGYKRPFDGA